MTNFVFKKIVYMCQGCLSYGIATVKLEEGDDPTCPICNYYNFDWMELTENVRRNDVDESVEEGASND